MADIADINAAQSIKIIGSDSSGVEQTPVKSTTLGELNVNDTPNQIGVNTTLNLTTTPILAIVGINPLSNRKYVEMLSLSNGTRWGYDITCPFNLAKDEFLSLNAGPACAIYVRMNSGTGLLVFAEK